jgi:hypothetical protein
MVLVTYARASLELVKASRQKILGKKRLCDPHDGGTKEREGRQQDFSRLVKYQRTSQSAQLEFSDMGDCLL